MSGAIDTKILVQHMQGNVASAPPIVPARVWTTPGACTWDPGSGSSGTLGPTVWNAFPGPPAFENGSNDLQWRAFHRCVRAPNSINTVAFYAYHRNVIYGLTAPPNWTAVHTCVSQRTDAASRDGGDHTGLYQVHSLDGSKLWFVGFYRTVSDTIGVVKFDTLANTWSSFDTGQGSHTLPFSVCCQYRGKLAHAGQSGLLLFDPESNTLQIFSYTGNYRDWVWHQSGRLFVVARQSPNLNVLEFAAGGFYNHGTVTGTTENSSNEGGWSSFSFTDGVFYIPYYTTTGGTGWRLEKVAVGSSQIGALDLTFSDLTSPVIPNSAAGIGVNAGILRWPVGSESFNRQQFLASIDNAEWPRGAFGTAGGVFAGFQLQCPAPLGTTKFQGGFHNLIWNGEGSEITLGFFPDQWCDQTGHYSFPVSRFGRGTNDFNGTGSWVESISAFSDGVVSRGLLVQFRLHEPNGGAKDWQLQYGSPPALVVGPGFSAAALSAGAGIDLGGTAVLNTAGPGGDTLDQLVGAFFNGSFPQAILDHGAVTSGPFQVGETVTGGTSGSTGTILTIKGTSPLRLGIQQTGGPGFTSGEVITGGISGASATLSANQDNDPLYQVVWDLDADGVADFDYAELSVVTIPTGTARPPGNVGTFVVGPTQLVLIPESVNAVTTASSEVAEPVVLSDAVPATASSEVAEPVVLSDAVPATASSEVAEPLATGDYDPNLYARVPNRAHTQPGWVNIQVNDSDTGGDQPNLSWDDATSGAAIPSGGQSGAPVSGDVTAELQFLLGATGDPQVGRLASVAGIDLTAGGGTPQDTVIDTVPTGYEWVVFGASVRCEAAASVTTPATAQIGYDASISNLFSSQLLAGCKTQDDVYDYPVGGESVIAGAGSTISFRITGGAVGTSQSGEVVLFGYARRL